MCFGKTISVFRHTNHVNAMEQLGREPVCVNMFVLFLKKHCLRKPLVNVGCTGEPLHCAVYCCGMLQ